MQAKGKPELITFPDGKIPPQSVETEETVLGGLLLDPNAINRIIDLLAPEDFYLSAHQHIYRAIAGLFNDSVPVDLMTVTNRLHQMGLLKQAGGQNKLADLLEFCVSAVNIDAHAKLIRGKSKRRQLIQAANDISRLARDPEQDEEKLIDLAEQLIFKVGSDRAMSGMVSIGDLLADMLTEVEQRQQNNLTPGYASGFYDLDAMTQGFQSGDLIVIAGRPAMGKTAFAMNTARNIAAFHNVPVAVFSLEMSGQQIAARLASAEGGIPAGQIKSANLRDCDWDSLSSAACSLGVVPIGVDDGFHASVSSIRSKARKYRAESGGLGAIVVDYLQLMDGAEEGTRNDAIGRITRGLKQLARELKCPIFLLSQLNRGVEARTNKRPMMADLRESGAIEQDADIIIMLYRDEYYNPDTPDRGIAEIIVAKHRNGPVGTVKLLFEPQFSRFRNLAR